MNIIISCPQMSASANRQPEDLRKFALLYEQRYALIPGEVFLRAHIASRLHAPAPAAEK